MSPEELLARMPKTEVHLHLEGTVGPDTLWALGQEYGVALPADSVEALRAMYAFESFDTFLQLWLAMHACFKDATAYERIVAAFLADCRRQNIRYVEAHFTPYNHDRLAALSGEEALAIVSRRLREAEAAGGPVVRLIVDIPSEALPESGEYTASLLERIADPVVVAIGLGGPEVGFPRTAAAPYFARARRAGYPAVAHAGETHVAEHVLQAVHELKVQRVQHGVQAVEDPDVLALLAERQICCDVTPVSNTFLTPYRDLTAHPIRRMIEAGVPVTLGTDDPAFFGVDLTTEYVRAHREIGLTLPELWQLNLNGLRYGLADVSLRRRLLQEFEAAGAALGIAGA